MICNPRCFTARTIEHVVVQSFPRCRIQTASAQQRPLCIIHCTLNPYNKRNNIPTIKSPRVHSFKVYSTSTHPFPTQPPPGDDAQTSNNNNNNNNPIRSLFTGSRPSIVFAGFYLEELPAIRHLLDAAGGSSISLVPCMPWKLDLPLTAVLDEGEPAWDQPMPENWVDGGGWGRKRIALFNDLSSLARGTIRAMLESSPVGDVLCVSVTVEDLQLPLGAVLSSAMRHNSSVIDDDSTDTNPNELDFIDSEESLPALQNVFKDMDISKLVEEMEQRAEDELKEDPDDDLPLDLIDTLIAQTSKE